MAPFQSSKPHPIVAEDEEQLEKLFDRNYQLEKEESRTSLPEPVDTLASKMEALKEEEEGKEKGEGGEGEGGGEEGRANGRWRKGGRDCWGGEGEGEREEEGGGSGEGGREIKSTNPHREIAGHWTATYSYPTLCACKLQPHPPSLSDRLRRRCTTKDDWEVNSN